MSITPIIESTTSARNALIGYENLLVATTTSDASKMLIANTYERYKPATGTFTVKFQLASAQSINYVAIGAHNAGTQNVNITIEYASTIGGSLTTIDVMSFTDDKAKMINFTAVTAEEIAITFTTTTGGLELGVIYAGLSLEMQRPIYGGHSPIDLALNTEYQSVVSETGQFLGRTITRKGVSSEFSWQHLTPEFIRGDFDLFRLSALTKPFFIKWRPDLYDSTMFGFTTDDIKPVNMGGGNQLMSVSFAMRGHA